MVYSMGFLCRPVLSDQGSEQ